MVCNVVWARRWHLLYLIDYLLGLGVLASLKVGVLQEIQRVELIVGVAHVRLGGTCGGSSGGQIRVNRFLPQAQARKNVRGHVQGMRRVGGDLGVATRGIETLGRKLRDVASVNQVVGGAGMVRLSGKELIENGNRLLPVGEIGVVVRGYRNQRKCVEGRRPPSPG